MDKRTFLKTVGCTIFLPALESFGQAPKDIGETKPKRLMSFLIGYGVLSHVIPQKEGKDYETSWPLKCLEPYRDQMSVYSEMQRRSGDHYTQNHCFGGGKGKTSMDQIIADKIGVHTKHRNLVSTIGLIAHSPIASWRDGRPVTPHMTPKAIFEQLFAKVDKKQQRELLDRKKSLLDGSLRDAKRMMASVSKHDKVKLEEYFSGLRESEKLLKKSYLWLERGQKEADFPDLIIPNHPGFDEKDKSSFLANDWGIQRALALDLYHMAFKFDLTRVISHYMVAMDPGHHPASHGTTKQDAKVTMEKYDATFYLLMSEFLRKLSETKTESGASLMDETITVATAGFSVVNIANKLHGPHNTGNLPVYVAGGGLKNHGKHIKRKGKSPYGIYNSIIKKFGVEQEKFNGISETVDL